MNTQKLLTTPYANEDQMTALLFSWVNYNYPQLRKVFFHVPNGGSRDAKEGMKFKAMGATPGIPDFICMQPRYGLELKMPKPKGCQSPDQKTVQQVWDANNIPYHLAWTMEQAVEVVISYSGQPIS